MPCDHPVLAKLDQLRIRSLDIREGPTAVGDLQVQSESATGNRTE